MKQTSRIISTYSADVFGVCSALFELGGMTIMHDASGCNSTYTTHDEPRWYDMDSMVYISGLSEMEAIMGDDEKLIGDIVDAAEDLKPAFIAVVGTPIPTMTGFDFESIAWMIEQRTGIPALGFPTTGMNTYVYGAAMAMEAYARRFCDPNVQKTEKPSLNILGVTPLDFSVNGTVESIEDFAAQAGYQVISKWAMGSTPEQLAQAGAAHVNLVVSSVGLGVAKALQEMFGTPYVIGTPFGSRYAAALAELLDTAAATGENQQWKKEACGDSVVIVGEGITSLSLAQAIEMETGRGVKVFCATECDETWLRSGDLLTPYEEDVEEALATAEILIADPLYKPICPKHVRFVALPSEACSGRIYRNSIPNLVTGLEIWTKEVF